MPKQVFNDDLMNLLATDFQRRYEPTFAWGNAMSMYLGLPGIMSFYPGMVATAPSSLGALIDCSFRGQHMSRTSGPYERADDTGLRRWIFLDGTDDYWSIGDNAFNSVLGTETSVAGAIRGLTVMAWVRPGTGADSTSRDIMTKWNGSIGQRSWRLFRQTATSGTLDFQVSNSGATTDASVQSTNILDIDEWKFVAARWNPSLEVKVWVGNVSGLVTDVNTTAIPATLFDSTESLVVGSVNTSSAALNFWLGDISLLALCRATVPDVFIDSIFDLTRPLFIRR